MFQFKMSHPQPSGHLDNNKDEVSSTWDNPNNLEINNESEISGSQSTSTVEGNLFPDTSNPAGSSMQEAQALEDDDDDDEEDDDEEDEEDEDKNYENSSYSERNDENILPDTSRSSNNFSQDESLNIEHSEEVVLELPSVSSELIYPEPLSEGVSASSDILIESEQIASSTNPDSTTSDVSASHSNIYEEVSTTGSFY